MYQDDHVNGGLVEVGLESMYWPDPAHRRFYNTTDVEAMFV